MIVTMDGPAGAGKSAMARLLADRLGFEFLDTGAMYRCVTLACLAQNVPLDDPTAVAACSASVRMKFEGNRVFLEDIDVTERIRTPEVTNAIRPIADNPEVRESLVRLQRQWAGERDMVSEGRDQGTVAFPKADCKIFLTASPLERARRRVAQLSMQGIEADVNEILKQQNRRDDEDVNRAVGALRAASDAVYVYTDELSEEQVLDRLVEIVEARRGLAFADESPEQESSDSLLGPGSKPPSRISSRS